MAKPRKHVYRYGDEVTITEPLIVTRVGYPLSMEAAHAHVEPLVRAGLVGLFEQVGARLHGAYTLPDDPVTVHVAGDPDYDRALRAIAHSYLRSKGFGGRDRTIHTELREGLRGKRAYVQSKRNVKTGRYHHGSSGYSYDGEWDAEPAYLDRAQTHVLLSLHGGDLSSRDIRIETGAHLEIEERHVQPYMAPWVLADQEASAMP
jgi:hypothetical protein